MIKVKCIDDSGDGFLHLVQGKVYTVDESLCGYFFNLDGKEWAKSRFEIVNEEKQMTKTTAEKIAVMQAYERGEKIEYSHKGIKSWFNCCGEPLWEWDSHDYRVAPPDTIPHTIDWSHVEQSLIYLYTDANKVPRLSNRMPFKADSGYCLLGDCIVTVEAKLFTSFKRGNVPWQDSLVVRPVDAKK